MIPRLLQFLILSLLLANSVFAETSNNPRQQLLLQLEQLAELKQSLHGEMVNWKQEQKTLQLQLQLLSDSLDTVGEEPQKKELAELVQDKKNLAEKLKKQQARLSQLNTAASNALTGLLQVHGKVPPSLQINLKSELSKLQQAQKGKLIDKLNALQRYSASLLLLQQEIHRVKEVVDVDGRQLEVTALYLGTFRGWFISKDGKIAGTLSLSAAAWKAEADPKLIEPVRTALLQLDREGKPQLVTLPITGAKK